MTPRRFQVSPSESSASFDGDFAVGEIVVQGLHGPDVVIVTPTRLKAQAKTADTINASKRSQRPEHHPG